MNVPREWHLDSARLGRRVLHFDRLDSTNTHALAYAGDPANDGLVILADEQTAGRGQHGRTWSCPGGSGVLMSLLLFPPLELRRPAILTAWAAASVCEVILKATGLQATIKWPNDVFVQGRKVCGILIEQSGGTVVGIGLNVNQPADYFTAAGLTQGTSLAVLTGVQRSCKEMATLLIGELDAEYTQFLGGDLATLEACWKWRLGLLGREVVAETAGEEVRGWLQDVTFRGVVIDIAAATRTLIPEAVQHLRAPGQTGALTPE
jgi:BirA family biotin operon repressor/biotin-[acetyl-CoA-carboxylase] ligase